MTRYLIPCLILYGLHNVFAQEGPSYVVTTNRPNQTDAIGVMEPGYLQLEAGIAYASSSSNTFESNILLVPALQFRYGIVKNVEVNIFYDYNSITSKTLNQEVTFYNQLITIGSKIHLWNSNGIIPQASGVINAHYIDLDGTFNDWDLELRTIFQNYISDRIGLTYMLRYRNYFAFAIVPSININDELSAFVEYYSDIGRSLNQDGINVGVGYLLNNNVTLDLMYGTVFDEISNGYITTGIGWWIR